MSKILLAIADRLVRRMDFAPPAIEIGAAHYGPIKPFRPDIAEAIARGEYAFQRLTSRKSTFRYRTIRMQVQQGTAAH